MVCNQCLVVVNSVICLRSKQMTESIEERRSLEQNISDSTANQCFSDLISVINVCACVH